MIKEKDINKLCTTIRTHNERDYYIDIRINPFNKKLYANIYLKITSDYGYWVASTHPFDDINILIHTVENTINDGLYEEYEEEFEYDDENWMPEFYNYDNNTVSNFTNLNIF